MLKHNLQTYKETKPQEITSFETIIPFKEITSSETIKLMKELISTHSPYFHEEAIMEFTHKWFIQNGISA